MKIKNGAGISPEIKKILNCVSASSDSELIIVLAEVTFKHFSFLVWIWPDTLLFTISLKHL